MLFRSCRKNVFLILKNILLIIIIVDDNSFDIIQNLQMFQQDVYQHDWKSLWFFQIAIKVSKKNIIKKK